MCNSIFTSSIQCRKLLGHSQEEGLRAISDLEANLRAFSKTLEMTEQKDTEKVKQEVPVLQQEALGYVGRVEEAMVQGFPFKVPDQYSSLPQLKVCGHLPTLPPLLSVPLGPSRKLEAPMHVGGVEKGMMQGFPFKVLQQQSSLPQLTVVFWVFLIWRGW